MRLDIIRIRIRAHYYLVPVCPTLTTVLYEITTITVTVNDYRATVRYAAAFAANSRITHCIAHVDNGSCVCVRSSARARARVICLAN